jgi:rhomboid protease GluP
LRSFSGFLRSQPVTALFLALLFSGYGLELSRGGSTQARVLVELGANVPALVLGGEPWRLLTSVFLHIGIVHLLLNAWAVYQLGGIFEQLAGSRRLATVLLASGIVGSATSVAWHVARGNPGLSAGASGAVFGVLGALVGLLLMRHQRLQASGRHLLSSLLSWAAINVVLGVTTPGIDNAAHAGGAVCGFLLGLTFRLPGDSTEV